MNVPISCLIPLEANLSIQDLSYILYRFIYQRGPIPGFKEVIAALNDINTEEFDLPVQFEITLLQMEE